MAAKKQTKTARRAGNHFWQVKNLAGNDAELILYGTISDTSWWGDEITPQQFIDDIGENAQHIVDQDGAVRQDDPLDRGVGDIPFMPESHVFQRCERIAPDDAGQSGHPFAGDGVAFVRHG